MDMLHVGFLEGMSRSPMSPKWSKELQKRSDGASLLQMLRSPEAPAELKRAHLKEAVIALKQLVQATAQLRTWGGGISFPTCLASWK